MSHANIRHVHSHQGDTIPQTQWSRDVWGNHIADRVADQDTSSSTLRDLHIIHQKIDSTKLLKHIQLHLPWSWTNMSNDLFVGNPQHLLNKLRMPRYLANRDENRKSRDLKPMWQHTTTAYAASIFGPGPVSQRVSYLKDWSGRNRSKSAVPHSLSPEEAEQWQNCELCHQPDDEAHLPCHCLHDTIVKLRDKTKTRLNKYITELYMLHKRPLVAIKLAEAMRTYAWTNYYGWRAFRGHWTPDAREALLSLVPELAQTYKKATLQILRKTAKDVGILLATLAKDTWAARCKHVSDEKQRCLRDLRLRKSLAHVQHRTKRHKHKHMLDNTQHLTAVPQRVNTRSTATSQKTITQFFAPQNTRALHLVEYQQMVNKEYPHHRLTVTDVPGDGDCLLHAIKLTGPESIRALTSAEIRQEMCDYLLTHKEDYQDMFLGLWTDEERPAQYNTYEKYVQHLREPMDLDIAICGNALAKLYSFRLICHSHLPVLELNSDCDGTTVIIIHTPGHFIGVTRDPIPTITSLLQRTFFKRFRTEGRQYKRRNTKLYHGTLSSYDETTSLFRATYEDGDFEDLDIHEAITLDFSIPLPLPNWNEIRPASMCTDSAQALPSEPDQPPTYQHTKRSIQISPSESPITSRSTSPTCTRHEIRRSRGTHTHRTRRSASQSPSTRSRTRQDQSNTLTSHKSPCTTYPHECADTVFDITTTTQYPTVTTLPHAPDTTSLVRGTLRR